MENEDKEIKNEEKQELPESEGRQKWRRGVFGTVTFLLAVMLMLSLPVFAWMSSRRQLGAYAPISRTGSLYIGAGHKDVDNFEDIRFLYFNGIDATDERGYSDHVFCVYGQFIGNFKLQLAFTTNNQFTYEIYNANELTAAQWAAAGSPATAVSHTVHYTIDDEYKTYYYTINGEAISGSFLNDTTVSGFTVADSSEHTATYGSYNNLDIFAEPLYWQSTSSITGNANGDFVRYFILRVNTGDKESNDRETDVLCIAAKSS